MYLCSREKRPAVVNSPHQEQNCIVVETLVALFKTSQFIFIVNGAFSLFSWVGWDSVIRTKQFWRNFSHIFYFPQEEPVDQLPALTEACKPKCAPQFKKYEVSSWFNSDCRSSFGSKSILKFQECIPRINKAKEGDCEAWYFDYYKCLDQCVRIFCIIFNNSNINVMRFLSIFTFRRECPSFSAIWSKFLVRSTCFVMTLKFFDIWAPIFRFRLWRQSVSVMLFLEDFL